MKKLRIIQLWNYRNAKGGSQTYLQILCTALSDAGHEVILIHADPDPSLPFSEMVRQLCIGGVDLPGGESGNRRKTPRVIETLESVDLDIVHIQANNNLLLEKEIRQRFPVIKSLHVYDFCPSGNKFHHALRRSCHHPTSPLCMARMGYKRCLLSKRPWVIWRHYRRCIEANQNNAHYPKLIVGSEYVKREAVASGYPVRQIEALPYFTSLPAISGALHDGEKGFPGPANGTILFTGRVVREKGLGRLLVALSMVRTPWRLIVDGDGPDLNEAKRLAGRLGVSGQIEFTGWADREQHSQFYQEASVVVVPSIWPEPFGLIGIEAMSYGKPVVAFKVGGIPEWLEDGVTGFLVKPYDVKEMADKISHLLEHPEVAREMGMRGRKRVEQEFNKEKHIARLLKIYEEVMNGRTQP